MNHLRRSFIATVAAALLPFSALAQRRKRKRKLPAKPQAGFANEVERRQVLQSFPSDRIRVALDVTFLLRAWTVEELDAELQRREAHRSSAR